jgi:large subunit ribosomal protein L15
MPLHRRMPKRGFTSIFRKEFNIVSLGPWWSSAKPDQS